MTPHAAAATTLYGCAAVVPVSILAAVHGSTLYRQRRKDPRSRVPSKFTERSTKSVHHYHPLPLPPPPPLPPPLPPPPPPHLLVRVPSVDLEVLHVIARRRGRCCCCRRFAPYGCVACQACGRRPSCHGRARRYKHRFSLSPPLPLPSTLSLPPVSLSSSF